MQTLVLQKIKDVWLHSGFQKYFKNTLWLLIGRISSLGFSFFTTIYVIRYLGPSNYGLLAFSISFVGLFSFIAGLGLDQILLRELAKNPEKKDELLGTSLCLRLTASLISIILIVFTAFITQSDKLTRILIFINSFTLFFGSFGIISFYFQSKVQAKYQAISLILVTLILSCLKIAVILFDKGIIYFSIVFFLENIFYAIILFFLYTKTGNSIFDWKVKKDTAIALLRDSWPLMISTAFILVYTRIDQVMIKFTTNNFNVGIYDAAVRISEIWYFIPSLITGSLLPAIINSKKISTELFRIRIIRLYSLMFYLAVIVALPVTFFSKFIIQTIYGNEFIQSAGVLSIYVWAGIPVFLSIAMNAYLLTENKTNISFISSMIGMVINIILNLIFIPIYGINGAATATLISYTCIPLSIFFFRSAGYQFDLVKQGIMYPFSLINKHRWTQK